MITPDDLCKNLEELENDNWGSPEYNSRLVIRTHELRRLPLNKFTAEDLRMMIGQKFSLDYLVPVALELLTPNLFPEGDLYEGALLENILKLGPGFWKKNIDYWYKLDNLMKDGAAEIKEEKIDTTAFYDVMKSE